MDHINSKYLVNIKGIIIDFDTRPHVRYSPFTICVLLVDITTKKNMHLIIKLP